MISKKSVNKSRICSDKQPTAGLLIPIAAPSGTGKTTVCHALLAHDERFVFSVSCTTRPARSGEVDGRDYHFISRSEFETGIRENRLAEWQEVFGHYYGTLRSALDATLRDGRWLLLDIDAKGALNLKRQYTSQTLTIFLQPPSPQELLRRLAIRGTETDASLTIRQARIPEELQLAAGFDHIIINDELEQTVQTIYHLVKENQAHVASDQF